VKPGGILVYATCSVFPSENHHQIRTFLDSVHGAEFELEKERYLLPSECGFDGFYMALLKRK
jgi:16S rRNA (cytosine967-C5)-methyltransferase